MTRCAGAVKVLRVSEWEGTGTASFQKGQPDPAAETMSSGMVLVVAAARRSAKFLGHIREPLITVRVIPEVTHWPACWKRPATQRALHLQAPCIHPSTGSVDWL
ncbi:uncharacterized protein B0I36DRAFT_158025 [Microdochium trichocladiopsis]|uniref:Uncharacterized protein n=1 Tax=Microdochium trichocladiopsis TaxID=1682393 RepID=A0A9P9BML7_9PEZI|nr:uncharacterized protein B0I36DRAFT_158025 [Microdochium trichocladiopsis]KAH7026398.1 hypothetical protein B0I36DRAFT_158025 [Microdochium trichocladiopsis]